MAEALRLTPMTRGDLLVAAPKTTQAVFAAIGDYYTWKLAGRVYGLWSNEAWVAVCKATMRGGRSSDRANGYAACPDRSQPMAVVLLHSDSLKLLGNHFDHYCIISVALAMVC